MRSRYTAFARGDVDHLLRTWHPTTRPTTLTLDPSIRWTRLEVLDRVAGGLLDTEGIVEFRAHHREGQRRGVLHERSRFVREAGQWFYRTAEPRQEAPTGLP
jgi:SEC-C motif-containing protein